MPSRLARWKSATPADRECCGATDAQYVGGYARGSGPEKRAPRHSEWVAGPRQLERKVARTSDIEGAVADPREASSLPERRFLPMWTNANDLQTDTFPGRIPLSPGVSRRHVRRACEPTDPR